MKLRLPVKYTLPPPCFTALNTHGAQPAMASMSPLASAVTASGGERFTNWSLAKSTPVSRAMAWMAIVTDAPFRHADLHLLEILRRADDLLTLLAEDDLLGAGDVALGAML